MLRCDSAGMEISKLLPAGTLSTICSRDRLSQPATNFRHSQALTVLHCCLQSLLLIIFHQNYVQNLAVLIHAGYMLRTTTRKCMCNFTVVYTVTLLR